MLYSSHNIIIDGTGKIQAAAACGKGQVRRHSISLLFGNIMMDDG